MTITWLINVNFFLDKKWISASLTSVQNLKLVNCHKVMTLTIANVSLQFYFHEQKFFILTPEVIQIAQIAFRCTFYRLHVVLIYHSKLRRRPFYFLLYALKRIGIEKILGFWFWLFWDDEIKLNFKYEIFITWKVGDVLILAL